MSTEATAAADARVVQPRAGIPWKVTDTALVLALLSVSAALRLRDLGDPSRLIFDEAYYAPDACWYLAGDDEICGIATERTWVHPPLGKWLIAAGIRLFGYSSFGWRISATVAGIITVILIFLLARRLLQSRVAATVAAGLLALDFMHFVHSRLAMLDVFSMMFGAAAFVFLVYDRDWVRRSLSESPISRGPSPGRLLKRPWRAASGLMLGAAVACKWSGGLFLIAAVVLAIAWDVKTHRQHDDKQPNGVLRTVLPSIAIWFLLVPGLIYAVTFVGRFDGGVLTVPWSEGSWIRGLVDRHIQMADFHVNVDATSFFQSPAWSWFLLKRPLSELSSPEAGSYTQIIMTGNPLVWWSAVPVMFYVCVSWAKNKGTSGAETVVAVGFVLTYGFWLLPWERSATYIFYALPSLVFVYLGIGYLVARIERLREGKAAAIAFSTAAIVLFAFYWPVLVGRSLPEQDWRRRVWFFDQCRVDSPATIDARTTGTGGQSAPPTGWCWM